MLRSENGEIVCIFGDGGSYCILGDTLLPSNDEINIFWQIFDQAFEAHQLLRCDDALDGQARVQRENQFGFRG